MTEVGCTYDWPINEVPEDWTLPFWDAGLVLKFGVTDLEENAKLDTWNPDTQPRYMDHCDRPTLFSTTFYSRSGVGLGKVWLSWEEAFAYIRCVSANRSKTINQILLALGATNPMLGDVPTAPFCGFLDLFDDPVNLKPQTVCDLCSRHFGVDARLTYGKTHGSPISQWTLDFTAKGGEFQVTWVNGFDLVNLVSKSVLVLSSAEEWAQQVPLNEYRLKMELHELLSTVGVNALPLCRMDD